MTHILKAVPKGQSPFPGVKPTTIGFWMYIHEDLGENDGSFHQINIPVVISLHGKGDGAGKDTGTQKGLDQYEQKPSHLPYLLNWSKYSPRLAIIMPQTVDGFLEGKPLEEFTEYIRELFQTENIGIMGMSAGGASVWKARMNQPNLFKAFVPICGVYLAKETYPPSSAALWAHHGAKDVGAPLSGGCDPKWTVWNCGYLKGSRDLLEMIFKNVFSRISEIQSNLNFSYDERLGTWMGSSAQVANSNETISCTIHANEGHGVHYKVYGFIFDWFINVLTAQEQPPVEDRPLKHLTDGELALMLSERDFPWTSEEMKEHLQMERSMRISEIEKTINL